MKSEKEPTEKLNIEEIKSIMSKLIADIQEIKGFLNEELDEAERTICLLKLQFDPNEFQEYGELYQKRRKNFIKLFSNHLIHGEPSFSKEENALE